MRNIRKIKKQHEGGFSLFTVIVAVSFVGILGLLVLYIALANFQMKVTDLKGKDSFYTAERALEEIRAGLQEDVGNAMSAAYTQVLEAYNKDNTSQDESMDKQRQNDFQTRFISELVKRLKNGDNSEQYSLEHLCGYVDIVKDTDVFDEEKESLIITNPSGFAPEMQAIQSAGNNTEENGVLLKNLKVIYVDPKGHASIIRTDIRLQVPEVQFPTPSTLPDLMNMIVVADKGIIVNGNTQEPTSIKGSIYAGLLPQEGTETSTTSIQITTGAALNVESGDKVVCEGEINVGQNSVFTSGSGVNLWAKGLNAESVDNVSLLGSTYFSDDLTISGKNNNVKIAGNYYGYGSESSAENCVTYEQYQKSGMTGADLSSAIVVNGKNTTLDLSGAEKVMVAGRNYIASSKVKAINGTSNTNDIVTGESITVKGTQLAYLVPGEIIGNGTAGNPMTFETYSGKMSIDGTKISVQSNVPVAAWGNRTLADIGVDSAEPVKTVFYNDNSNQGYVYVYLNFTDPEKSAEFMQMYYQNNPTIKQNMDKYLSFYFGGENNGIDIKDPDTYLRYITNGNALTFDGDEQQGDLQQATSVTPSEKVLQEQVGYQNSWYALNRKMISSYDLLNKEVKEDDGGTHDETSADRSVFDNLVNAKKMVEYIRNTVTDGSWKYTFTASDEDGGLQAVMYHNAAESTFTTIENNVEMSETVPGAGKALEITDTDAEKLRLVVCTGDVVIDEDVTFKGIIMTNGKITLEKGAQLESSPLEAARVFQAQMTSYENDEQNVKAQDFFWEGDKYVLGNSQSSGNIKLNGSDSYSIADCVIYENWKKE